MSATAEPSTIFALSSGHGRAGVAVIRMSGPMAGCVLEAMASPRPLPRRAALRRIIDPASGELLDVALVLLFSGPASETGEDIAELHLHGSPAVIRAVLACLSRQPGCRLAEPGEFARRAFMNGKIDLTAAEGLADLIDAETDAQRRQALAQAGGAFARTCDAWRDRLLEARALTEAAIDFSDEADVAETALADARSVAVPLREEIDRYLAGANRGEIVRAGFRVVLAGPPNAGKSSLLNALAKRDVAIVSPEPGTTRDVLEAHLDLGGYAVTMTDTAGLRESTGSIEREGISRALERARHAHLIIWLIDATNPVWTPPPELGAAPGEARRPVLTVVNKADMLSPGGPLAWPAPGSPAPDPKVYASAHTAMTPMMISATTGIGLQELIAHLAATVRAAAESGTTAEISVPTQLRHRTALQDCRAALDRFLDPARPEPELAAEDLRLAADALGRITGRIDAEQILGLIFGRFCIGK